MCGRRWCGLFFFFQAEDGIRDYKVTGVQTCALPIYGGTGDTVYDLASDQPLTRWGATLSASLAADGVIGPPAIGAGDATTARVYVASAIGDLYAINPDGGAAWTNVTSATSFVVGPAIAQANISGGTVDEMIVPDGVGGGNSKLWRATSATDVTSVASANRDFHAAPLILH